MPKFDCHISIGLEVDAPTVEAAIQEIDNSVDLSQIRSRGYDINHYSNHVSIKGKKEE